MSEDLVKQFILDLAPIAMGVDDPEDGKILGHRWFTLPIPSYGGDSPQDLCEKGHHQMVWTLLLDMLRERICK